MSLNCLFFAIIIIVSCDYIYFIHLVQQKTTSILLCTVITTFLCPSSDTEMKHLIQMAFLTRLIQIKTNNVKIVLYSQCELYKNFSQAYDISMLPFPRVNEYGTPFFLGMIHEITQEWPSLFYLYINGDILLSPNTFLLLSYFYKRMQDRHIRREFLGVGRRRDLHFATYSTSTGTHEDLWKSGKEHGVTGIDFFIITKDTYNVTEQQILNNIIIGRKQYDNILVALAVIDPKIYVVDCTHVLKPVHLDDCRMCKKRFLRTQKDYDWNMKYLQEITYDRFIKYGFTDKVIVLVKEVPEGSRQFEITTSPVYHNIYYLTEYNIYRKHCADIDIVYMLRQKLGKCFILTAIECPEIASECVQFDGENVPETDKLSSLLLYSDPYSHILSRFSSIKGNNVPNIYIFGLHFIFTEKLEPTHTLVYRNSIFPGLAHFKKREMIGL